MSTFDLLEKRRHVRKYRTDKHPPYEVVEKLLWKTWKTTPSKNNFMPYNCHILGPDKKEEKIKVWNKSVYNHQTMEDQAVKDGYNTKAQGFANPYYEHIKYNSYLLVFSSRVCDKPNPYYERQIKTGHFAEQLYPEWVERIADTACVEVGMFISNMTMFCMEEGIDVSYTSCFPRRVELWKDVPYVKYRPLLLMSLGYSERYRYEDLEKRGELQDDIKPDIDKVIKWI